MLANRIYVFAKKCKAWVARWFTDGLALAGEACLVIGAYMLHPIAAWLVAGALLIVTAVFISKGRGEER